MLILYKAINVKNPGSRGGDVWIDDKGRARYDARPSGVVKRKHIYLAHITLSDGTKKYIEPNDAELDEEGQIKGGQSAIREIINRELFGDYGFKPDGTFWQKKGLLIEYKTRTDGHGKVVVDSIQRHAGYTSFELRDSSVERAYGAGLPKKITKYQVEAKPHEDVPSKEKIELPVGGTADRPPIEEMGVASVQRHLPENKTSIGVPLQPEDDPLALADAYLETFLRSKKPSQAKTPEGQARARDERKGQFDGIVGARKIEKLPMWAVNKYESPAELQADLSRGEGRPLTTLITLGLWNTENKTKRVREQLVSEWAPFLRRWAKRFGSVFAGTDVHRNMTESGSQKRYMYDRERDLYNEGVAVLLDEANKYVANDEPRGQYSRFDLRAENVIKNHMERVAKDAAVELGATALEDLHENAEFKSSKMISPREHYELRHYEPIARKILKDAIDNLPENVRKTFEARMWMDDDVSHPDNSQEHAFAERRARQTQKTGRAGAHWGRPWTGEHEGVQSIAEKLADTPIPARGGEAKTLGEVSSQLQKYHLEQWFNDALHHVHQQLRTKNGGLTPDGVVVEKWLRLETKVAQMNRREIADRTQVPVSSQSLVPPQVTSEHVRVEEHPSVTFFKQPGSNRELAEKLGLASTLNIPPRLKNVSAPKNVKGQLDELNEHHKLAENLKRIPNLSVVHEQAHGAMQDAKDVGAWITDERGNAQWHEKLGVTQLHDAAIKLHSSRGDDATAVTQFTNAANALGDKHPMVREYMSRLATQQAPTNSDLATWKTRSHAEYRKHQNRLHVVEFEQDRRNAASTGDSLKKAFSDCLDAYDQLSEVIRC